MPDPSSPPRPPVHPFRRFFARQFDDGLAVCVVLFVAQIVWGRGPAGAAFQIQPFALWIPALLLWCIIEAAILAMKGNTPGKWLFGIHVRALTGDYPEFWSTLNRSFNALLFGQGFLLPLVGWYSGVCAYRDLTERGVTSWDRARFAVHGGPFAWRRKLLAITLIAVLLVVFAVLYALLF